MYRNKIFLTLMLAALTSLLLTSASFIVEGESPESFTVASKRAAGRETSDVIRASADLGVGALYGSLAQSVGENVDKATTGIYAAYIEKQEKKTEEKAESQAAPASSAQLTGMEAEILSLINATRASYGVPTLAVSGILVDLARLRSGDMVARGYFSHFTPEGENITHILSRHGVAYRNFGENLGRANPAATGSPSAFLSAWMNSASHRDNMLKGYYTSVGVGVSDGGGIRVVTVIFIR